MNNNSVKFALIKVILMSCMFLAASACSHFPQNMSPTELQHAYSPAIKDAEIAEYNEIYRNLVAIVPSNDALRWNKDTGEVLVTTWTSWDGYDDHVGRSIKLSRECRSRLFRK